MSRSAAKLWPAIIALAATTASAAAFTPPSRVETFFNYLKQTASETLRFNENIKDRWYNRFNNLQIQKNVQNSLQKIKEIYDDQMLQQNHRNLHEKAGKRSLLEKLGETRISSEGKTLNDHAREIINKLRPDLRETDYYNNPARTISYFILLDPRGFIENVKIIRGPLDMPMTLKEAYEFYSRTDPEKAKKILNMLESLQKLYMPDSESQPLDVIIESIGQTIELLNHQSDNNDKSPQKLQSD